MIDILFLAHGRPEFTKASLSALIAGTDWSDARLLVYTDGEPFIGVSDLKTFVDEQPHGGPVGIMNHYLQKRAGTEVFAKIDNDVIVPPGWLARGLDALKRHPSLGLLGIEPPSSTVRIDLSHANGHGCVRTDSIGGIGLMRRSAFAGQDSMRAHAGGRGGFTDWQLRHPEIEKGWLSPPLDLFLLDRLPFEPWHSLSRTYIERGEQRPWLLYSESDSHLWSWWTHGFERGGPTENLNLNA